jgi:cytochrome c-type biogenesis protein CcmF
MADLGSFALLVALVASLWSVIVGVAGARGGGDDVVRSAEGALKGSALALTVAGLCLFGLLLAKDFSVEYVTEYTSRSLSVFYTLGAFWAGQAGSLLLWGWMVALAGALVLRQNRDTNRELMPWVTVVIGITVAFFVVLVQFYANPFQRLDVVPADGQGLNPLLQNYGQWIHPVTLYLGFVGLTVPFAFAISALITGRLNDRWIRLVRKWTLWSWVLLTAGILFGARWAYVELGWGGYWAWDPVENASLMPWLIATAYLHSVVVQEKRGLMRVWNVSLVTMAFGLSIFGTFLTRSGIVSSVHAFGQSAMGPLLLGFTAAIVLVSTALIVWRLPDLRRTGRFGAIVSRESAFLLTNVLLVGIAAVVVWGSIYPVVAQAVRGIKASVGPGFFQAIVTPIAVLLIAVVGICPLLAWRHANMKHLRRNFAAPGAVGAVAFGSLLAVSRGSHLGVAVVVGLGAFALTTAVEELRRGFRARRDVHGETRVRAARNLFALTPRRYGGPLIHAGVVVLLAGIAFNIAYKQEVRDTLVVGGSTKVGGYTLTLRNLTTEQDAARFAVVGVFGVRGSDGADLGTIRAEQAMFQNDQQETEVGIRASLGADLYVAMNGFDLNKHIANVDVFVEPAILWIWVGMGIVLVGGVIAAWPRRANMQAREVLDERPRLGREQIAERAREPEGVSS